MAYSLSVFFIQSLSIFVGHDGCLDSHQRGFYEVLMMIVSMMLMINSFCFFEEIVLMP